MYCQPKWQEKPTEAFQVPFAACLFSWFQVASKQEENHSDSSAMSDPSG